MKVLTATAQTQGQRENDYNWCVEGELVWITPPCATDGVDPDGPCGCGRGFAGLSSHRATTTARVRDLQLSRNDMITAVAAYYESAGYAPIPAAELEYEVDEMLDIAAAWKVGTIIERRIWTLQNRAPIAA